MKQKELDKIVKGLFGKMSESDLRESERNKDQIWAKLDNPKEKDKPKYRWLLWLFVLSFLVAGLLLFSKLYKTKPADTSQEPKLLLAQIEQLKSEIMTSKSLMKDADTQKSYLEIELKKLRMDFEEQKKQATLASQPTTKNNTLIYKLDTIYITKIETQNVVVDHFIRDTVYLESLNVEIENIAVASQPDSTSETELTKEADPNETAELPSSVQYNFSEIDLEDSKSY